MAETAVAMDPSGNRPVERRRFARAPGPFNGWQIGPERTRIRVINLNIGGCFVFADPTPHLNETPAPDTNVAAAGMADNTIALEIDLGVEGVIEVLATALVGHRPGGMPVAFVNVSPAAVAAIQRTVNAQED